MSSFIEEIDSKHRVPGLKVAYLHNVSVDSGKAAQSNKFYYLFEQTNGTVRIVRGRIDHTFVIEPKTPSIHEWDKIRKQVYERDHRICRACGKVCGKKEIQSHHIVKYRKTHDNSMDNLGTVCDKCHPDVEDHPELIKDIKDFL